MAHLLSCRLLHEACTTDNLAIVTERAKACERKWENIIIGVVCGKPNHLLVHMISSNFRCVFSTSKLATIGRQMSVMIGNEANRTNTNIKRTIHI